MVLLSCVHSSNSRDHAIHPTHITTPAYLVIPFLSPTLSPWILYDPVRLLLESDRSVAGGAVTHQKHPVIQMLFSADIRAWDSPNVCLHEHCIDANCKGAIVDQICSNLIFVKRNNAEVGDSSNNFALVKFAGTAIRPSVRVVFLLLQTPSLECVLKGIGH